MAVSAKLRTAAVPGSLDVPGQAPKPGVVSCQPATGWSGISRRYAVNSACAASTSCGHGAEPDGTQTTALIRRAPSTAPTRAGTAGTSRR